MKNRILAGIWRLMVPVPQALWQKQIQAETHRIQKRLAFMTPDHRRVHHLAVRELPGLEGPMGPEFISQRLDMPVEQVNQILDDLEKNLTFLFRSGTSNVTWAYPVSAEKTPHHLTLDTGETIYAA